MANLWLDLGTISPIAHSDLNGDDAAPKQPVSTIAFLPDKFGATRAYTYIRNTKGSASSQGDVFSRPADVTEASVTTGSTTGWTKTAAIYGTYTGQPGAFVGQLVKVDTNGSSAGAAPEGESSICVSNTATAVNTDSRRAFSAAIPATSAVRVINFSRVKLCAASDLANLGAGVGVGANGISDGNWGWAQIYGVCPDVKHKATTAFTAGDPVIADVGTVGPKGATTAELWWGWQIGTHNNPVTSNKSPIFLMLYGWVRPVA